VRLIVFPDAANTRARARSESQRTIYEIAVSGDRTIDARPRYCFESILNRVSYSGVFMAPGERRVIAPAGSPPVTVPKCTAAVTLSHAAPVRA